MTTWALDLKESVGQRVLADAPCWDPADRRFRTVRADNLREALAVARQQVVALDKLALIQSGGTAIMSDRELDWLIDWDLHPTDVASIPNPQRCGLLDAYLVAKSSHPQLCAWRSGNKAGHDLPPNA